MRKKTKKVGKSHNPRGRPTRRAVKLAQERQEILTADKPVDDMTPEEAKAEAMARASHWHFVVRSQRRLEAIADAGGKAGSDAQNQLTKLNASIVKPTSEVVDVHLSEG